MIIGNYFYPHLFSTIEVHLGIVSACLPTLRPLVQHAFGGVKSSIGDSPGEMGNSDQEESYRGVVDSKTDSNRARSELYGYQVIIRSKPSETSMQSGGERLLNPNDLSFWRSAES